MSARLPVLDLPERGIRRYASHLALQVRGPKGGPFTLEEKYGPPYGTKRRVGGPYHSVDALERASRGTPSARFVGWVSNHDQTEIAPANWGRP